MPSDDHSRPTSDAYRDGWERIWGKKADAEEIERDLEEDDKLGGDVAKVSLTPMASATRPLDTTSL